MNLQPIIENEICTFYVIEGNLCYFFNKKETEPFQNDVYNDYSFNIITDAISFNKVMPKSIIFDITHITEAEIVHFKLFLINLLKFLVDNKKIKYIGSIMSKDTLLQASIRLLLKESAKFGVLTLHFADFPRAFQWVNTIK